MATESREIQPYEKEHINFLKENSAECTFFLNKNDAFPLDKPCKLLLVGAGACETIKAGTGSDEVESRYIVTCEQCLESAGFEIVSKDWLEKFPQFKKAKRESFVNYIKQLSEDMDGVAAEFQMGGAQPETEYDLPLEYQADAAIFIVSRISGENQDRR